MENKKILKEIEINGVKVKIELLEDEIRKFPEKIDSIIKVRDKKLKPISIRTVFF
tara:strand:+ start:452 stop:616 length:165 start_codon:yes stop_codon:yes gene_type:complete